MTLETAEQLADLLVDAGDLIAAWKLRRQLLEWYRSAYGEDLCSDFGVCYSFGVSKIHLQLHAIIPVFVRNFMQYLSCW